MNRKKRLTILGATSVLSSVLVFMGLILATSSAVPRTGTIDFGRSTESLLESGLAVVVAQPKPATVTAYPGQTVEVDAVFTYRVPEGGDELPVLIIDLTDLGRGGQFRVPSSVMDHYDIEQVREAMTRGELLPGVIRISDLLSYKESSIILSPGESKTVRLMITVHPELFAVRSAANIQLAFTIHEKPASVMIEGGAVRIQLEE